MAGLLGCEIVCDRTASDAGAGRLGCRGAAAELALGKVGESSAGGLARACSVLMDRPLNKGELSSGDESGDTGEEPSTAFSRWRAYGFCRGRSHI